jgi:type VI secretion system secreted protein Hcp
MAMNVHCFLKVNGADVEGDSSVTSLGREGSIECVYFEQSVKTVRSAVTGQATGRRQHEPILIRKPIDRSSPLLAKALAQNSVVDAEFRFYRPNPAGDGTTQHFYTVAIKQGRIASFKDYLPPTTEPANSLIPPLEEVGMVFTAIRWTHVPGGIEHEDTWSGLAARKAVARPRAAAAPGRRKRG